jgi:hypothetical protein
MFGSSPVDFFSDHLASLDALWFAALPFVLVASGVAALWERWRKRRDARKFHERLNGSTDD